MKKLISVFLLAAFAIITLMSGFEASAKRAKWYCYAPDPSTPWIQTCYSSTSRP